MNSDTELMLEFRNGRTEAFRRLVKRHQVGLVNFFHKMIWDRDIAEDLTQEVFLRLYTHRDGYEPKAKFTTYLYRIARNCAVDYLRKTRHDRKVKSLDAESDGGVSLYDDLLQRAEGPAETASRGELASTVEGAIRALSEEHRIVFVLSEVKGMRYAEISEVLGIPVGTIKSRMHNATRKLRDRLIGTSRPGAAPAE